MTDGEDQRFLAEAIRLAREGVRGDRGGPFGAVVVRAGEAVGRGENRVLSTQDPTAHAEVVALRAAAARLGTHELTGCVLYASCEPCPMCLGAAWWARVERVVFAASRDDAAAAGFDDAALYEELARPLEARRLTARHVAVEDALAPFRDWQAKEDRIPY